MLGRTLVAPLPDTTYGRVNINRNESAHPLQWLLVVFGGLAAAVLTRTRNDESAHQR